MQESVNDAILRSSVRVQLECLDPQRLRCRDVVVEPDDKLQEAPAVADARFPNVPMIVMIPWLR